MSLVVFFGFSEFLKVIFLSKNVLDRAPSSVGGQSRASATRSAQPDSGEKKRVGRRKKTSEASNALPTGSVEVTEEHVIEDVVHEERAQMSQKHESSQASVEDGGPEAVSENAAEFQSDEDGYYTEQYDESGEYYGSDEASVAQNQIVVTLSYSLMNQVRQTARMEGVLPEDIIVELVAEGVTRRAFEDAQRPAPSHLMTRTGYVAPDANGNVMQPQLSHHGMQGNNRQNQNRRFNQNNNRGNHYQGQNRNRQNNHFKNKQRNGK